LFRKPYQISVPAFLRSYWLIFSSVHSQTAFGTIFIAKNCETHHRSFTKYYLDL
jgi:hypothetical protein